MYNFCYLSPTVESYITTLRDLNLNKTYTSTLGD